MWVILFCAVFSLYAQAPDSLYADSICAYTWNDSVGGCTDVLGCIHPGIWNDTVIPVPGNITSISPNGLKLCLDEIDIAAPVDVIYILDLSEGMLPDANQSGDPYKKRDDAIEAGFGYQINNLPLSSAGYIGFGTGIVQDHLLQPVPVQSGQDRLAAIVTVIRDFVESELSGGGKDYKEALREAIVWLQDSLLCPHEAKTVIFISNGEPDNGKTPSEEQLRFLSDNTIPVHCIYLDTGAVSQSLSDLASRTGGQAVLVPPANTDTLASAVIHILETIRSDFAPTGITVQNMSTGSSADGLMNLWNMVDDTVWTGPMDKSVALQPDLNEISVRASFQTADGSVDTAVTFGLYIDVGGEDRFTSECFYCWYRSRIQVLVSDVPVDTLTWQDREYTIRLFHYGDDTLDQVTVVIHSELQADTEVVTLTDRSFDGEKFIYEATVPFVVQGASQNATPGNGITEAVHDDRVTLFWRHPEEVLDTAYSEVVVSGLPDGMAIHSKAGQPDTASKYATAPAVDTVTAGIPAGLYAKVFTGGTWLDAYETDSTRSQMISWEVTEVSTGLPDSSIGILTGSSGSHNTYFPAKAFHTVDITASLTLGTTGTVKETIRLSIRSGAAKQLVIENTDSSSQTRDLNSPCHWSPIEIFSDQTAVTAYAILRDSLGNWAGPATEALWTSEDTAIATVNPGPGESGTLHKNQATPSGSTLLHAAQSGMEDTAIVMTYPYLIDSIRIVVLQGGTDTVAIENLTMNTNEDTILQVIGKRDDFGTWMPVDAQWGITPSATEQNPPAAASQWFFSPSQPDSGIIYTHFSGKQDTITWVFTVGQPIEAGFAILTPDSLLRAGEVVQGIVSIKNEDGPVPGIWKYEGNTEAAYTDILGDGTDDPVNPIHTQWMPFCQTDQSSSVFDNKELHIAQWFDDGIDTVDFVLYYAPDDARPHQLTVRLDSLSASTSPFTLSPGIADSMVLVPDTLPELSAADPPLFLSATGYDQFGNKKAGALFRWYSDTTLVDFAIDALAAQLYIDPSGAKQSQEGFIHVTSVENTTLTDSIYLRIVGSLPGLLRALTRDYNGNGFLDAIELHFNKPVTVPAGYDASAIVVQLSPGAQGIFMVDSLVQALPGDGMTLTMYLHDADKSLRIGDQPETGWVPYVTVDNCETIQPIRTIRCVDGAAPVIWQAGYASDAVQDEITVIMSEPFYNRAGEPFMSTGPAPSSVFAVWELANGSFVRNDSILAGINQFTDQQGRWATFKVTNGNTLNASHYLSLDVQNSDCADTQGNIPIDGNQKIQIANVIGIIHTPEPVSSPVLGLHATPNPVTRTETVHFLLPTEEHHAGVLRIYDAVGNCVDERDVRPGITTLIWDLRNQNRRVVSPGSYLVVFTFQEKDTGVKHILKVMVGVKDK